MENNYELFDLEELKFEIESLDSKEEMLFEAKKNRERVHIKPGKSKKVTGFNSNSVG